MQKKCAICDILLDVAGRNPRFPVDV